MSRIGIAGTRWTMDGAVTYPGAAAEGLLMNVRMVNATFEDRRRDFDAAANTRAFLASLPDYIDCGVRAFTLCLQGGMPGYEGALNSAFAGDGTLRADYLERVGGVIRACGQAGAAVILGCFYQRQDQVLADADGVRNGVVNVARWIGECGFANVVLEVANEYAHQGFSHQITRQPAGQVELIGLAKEAHPGLIVSTSGMGSGRLDEQIAAAADCLLIHFNTTPIAAVPERIEALRGWGKPILCNEDTKVKERGAEAAALCVELGCSWGLMNAEVNQYQPFVFGGRDDDAATYARLRALTAAG